jgi:glycerophosphoryl diester phosphodiesterase
MDAPENTLAAFELAVSQGANAIELDVKLCGSGEPVVIHDRTVDRTTNGTGEVGSLSLSALKALDAGSWFDSEFAGEGVPTLDEVFRRVGQDTLINVELTNYQKLFDRLPEAVAEVVHERRVAGRVWFSSFNPISLRRIRQLLPGTPVGLLLVRGGRRRLMRAFTGALTPYDAVHPEFSDLNQTYVDEIHRSGRAVFPYTINDPDEIRQAFNLGVDGVITDVPVPARRSIPIDSDERSVN